MVTQALGSPSTVLLNNEEAAEHVKVHMPFIFMQELKTLNNLKTVSYTVWTLDNILTLKTKTFLQLLNDN